MAYTYEDFEKAANSAGLLGQFSQYDLDLAQKYPEFGLSILSLKQDYQNAATDEQRLLANEAANQLRSSYGNYTGGVDGSQYISTGKLTNDIDSTLEQIGSFGSFSYDTPAPTYSDPYAEQRQTLLDSIMNREGFSFDMPEPTYTNQYAEQQAALLDAILNREDFFWSKETDPLWPVYKKEYLREGERATANALAQASAASGGIPSSYALTAASQAGDYYATQLSDIIPTLYQQAYDRYLDEYNMKLQDLGAVNNQEQLDYAKYLDQLAQYNTNRNFAYDQYLGDFDMDIQALGAVNSLDQTALTKFQTELDQYNKDRDFAYDAYLTDYDMLQTYLKNLQDQDTAEYNRAQDALTLRLEQEQAQKELLQAQIDAILSAGGTPSAELVGSSGYNNEYVQALEAEYQKQEAEKQQAELQAQIDAILSAGGTPSAELVENSGYNSEYVQALVAQYAKEQGLTEQEAARELADWAAGYGDYSKLAEQGVNVDYMQALQDAGLADWLAGYGDYSRLSDMGVDTGYLQAAQKAELAQLSGVPSGSGGSTPIKTPEPDSGVIPQTVLDTLKSKYPSGVVTDADTWNSLVSLYGEAALEAAGFSQGSASPGYKTLKYADLSDKAKNIADLMDSDLTTDYSRVITLIEQLSDQDEQNYLLDQLNAYLK